MSCNAKKDAFYGAPCDDIRDVSSRAISPTSFLSTVLISRRTRPSEIRQMMGGVQARRRPAISSEERVREDRATERVGRLTRGSAPPPIADSSSTTATVHPDGGVRALVRARALREIDAAGSEIIFNTG